MDLTPDQAALEVERHDCPNCDAPAGSACRTRGGKTAAKYHTPRFVLVPALREELDVPVPADRGPGRARKQGPVLAAVPSPRTERPERIGYARTSTARQELASQLEALHRAKCHKVFKEQISTRVKVRPELEKALALARQFKEAAPETPVIFTVHELKRLARNAAELMTLSADLQAGGIQLELLTGPLTGIYDPNGMGAMFFAVLAVAGQIERNYIREKTLEGQAVAASKGNHGGRPKVIDDDMLTFASHSRTRASPSPRSPRSSPSRPGRTRASTPRSPRCIGRSPKPRKPRRTTAYPGGPRPYASADPRIRSPPRRSTSVSDSRPSPTRTPRSATDNQHQVLSANGCTAGPQRRTPTLRHGHVVYELSQFRSGIRAPAVGKVDGPLNPYAAKPERRPAGYGTHRMKPPGWLAQHPGEPRAYVKALRVWLNPDHGRRLLDLSDRYDLVWATTWGSDANDFISPVLGLPALPVVEWPTMHDRAPDGTFWKTRHLVAHACGRPFAWVDDELGDRDRTFVRTHHPAAALLHHVDARHGLRDTDFEAVAAFVRTLGTGGRSA